MSSRDFCLKRRQAERPAFVKVLKAIPQDKAGYKPDPKSRTAAELAWLLAYEEQVLAQLLDTGSFEWKDTPAPAMSEVIAAYEKAAGEADERLAKVDDAAWARKGKMLVGGQAVWEDTTENMMWGFLFDAIHHRGQLSTYLRPMGSKVPAIYGPSADDSGQ